MGDFLIDVLNRPVPKRLWHYTSVQGFQGIVTSKAIFATDIRFLNDRTEFVHAQQVAAKVIAEIDESGTNLFPARSLCRSAVSLASIFSASSIQVFVASFSEAKDQLSQWRGYSRGSSGVSLGFDLTGVRPPVHTGTLAALAPCVYHSDEKKLLMRNTLFHFVKEAQEYWNKAFKAAEPSFRAGSRTTEQGIVDKVLNGSEFMADIEGASLKTQTDLLQIAALLKDESFHEESEWRLVLPVLIKTATPQFRSANTALIPYIAHPFSSYPDAALPLTEVILGPGSHVSACHAARAFLRSQNLDVEPCESNVPYRPW